MGNDKIYIIVPVYKVEPYLERCVDSILKQTYTNWELVLVDDGSPDNCPAICERYAAEHNNITVIHQENGGVSAARNTGIEYALKHGDLENNWINFIDSDDFVHPCYLEYLHRAATEAGVSISCCDRFYTETSSINSADQAVFSYICLSPEEYWCSKKDPATAWGKLYTLTLFEHIRYPLGKIAEDQFVTYKQLFSFPQIAVISEKLYYYFFNTTSIMRSHWSPKRLDGLEAIREQKDFFHECGYCKAYEKISVSHIQACISHYRSMYLTRYSKDAQKELKQEMHAALFKYSYEFGVRPAFRIWYNQHYIPWSKWRFKHSLIYRAISKIKRTFSQKRS